MAQFLDNFPIINVVNVNVLDNPSSITNPFQFEIIFEARCDLEDDLEWKMTYVGDYRSTEGDQVLDDVLVGPITQGTHKFCFQANAPNLEIIPDDCLIGVTVILITCCYHNHEFIRIGYYISNTCDSNWKDFSQIQREIHADKPRVTHTPICWE
ncbi:uncharacterized protein [Blastocystis hominis]|uniref:Uncharacterized protein n=1 Tax=Blastocystis hominis TaxID=12968 RepID=D8M3M0_BLAHO|nr:uncharacterized protein [Blastocystis hominis]CBK22493.2 unnamed protein product [Blastocystis hominis]|eukprot:XP_012896541.1 uncharacterized protein [Blastocystis hominis]